MATDVTRYLNFKSIGGCYVYKRGAGIHKVPATKEEALGTSLLSLLQKNYLRSLLMAIDAYKVDDPKTWKGNMDWRKSTCAGAFVPHGRLEEASPAPARAGPRVSCDASRALPPSPLFLALSLFARPELFKYMWFDKDTSDFVGHAMALEESDDYLSRPALPAMEAVRLYGESLARYGSSPFIYPEYGLGGLPEGFSRLCAIHNGTFMLNKDVTEILYNADGTVAGVRSGEGDDAEVALAPLVVGDPSYFPAARKVKTGRIIRTICVLNHPVAGLTGSAADSAMIILPASQVGRKNDIYITVVGKHHETAAKNRYIAIVSTTVETATPEKEVEAGLALLGEMVTRFNNISDTYAPKDDGRASKVFVTASYDATSHFEATTDEILDVYSRIFGENFDLTKPVALPAEGMS